MRVFLGVLLMVSLGGCLGRVGGPFTDAGVDGGPVEDAGDATDSGPVDAADAGGEDAGVDAGCGAQFCDDFERYDAGMPLPVPWVTSVSGGTVAVDGTRAHRGQRAVRVTTDGQLPFRRAYFGIGAPFFPVAGNAFYGRVWAYLVAAPPMTTHWTNIRGEGTAMSGGTPFQAVVNYGGQVAKQLMANYDSSVFKSDCWQHSTVAFPEGRWTCLEWHFDGPANRMEFWLDGTQIPELTVNQQGQGCINNGLGGQWVMPTFEMARLGWEHYQTSIPIEMWMDDVALDVRRLGCE